VDDYRAEARRRLPKAVYEYVASGSGDEQTLAENRAALRLWYLRPRVLRPLLAPTVSCASSLLGSSVRVPFFASPAGVMALPDPSGEGERGAARAFGRAGALFCLSQHSTRSIEDVARAAPPGAVLWYQCYLLRDRALTERLLRRAARSGYRAVVLTVDSPVFGFREADARNGFDSLPPPHRLANYHPEEEVAGDAAAATYNARDHGAWDQNSERLLDAGASWSDVRWVKERSGLPVVVKGVHTAEDAVLALEAGADAVYASNHGGRQLDGALAAVDLLPEVAAAVEGRVPVLVDGGFRRGTDVLKALALGASAVGVGRPVFFALAAGGEEAVHGMLRILEAEVVAAMRLCGCASLADVGPSLVARHPYGGGGGPVAPHRRAKL
jgi:isopentenyl diphosphate isomerase/L-lactate dehydrogenase-like FMN-dependent dehydrogenase